MRQKNSAVPKPRVLTSPEEIAHLLERLEQTSEDPAVSRDLAEVLDGQRQFSATEHQRLRTQFNRLVHRSLEDIGAELLRVWDLTRVQAWRVEQKFKELASVHGCDSALAYLDEEARAKLSRLIVAVVPLQECLNRYRAGWISGENLRQKIEQEAHLLLQILKCLTLIRSADTQRARAWRRIVGEVGRDTLRQHGARRGLIEECLGRIERVETRLARGDRRSRHRSR